MANKESIARIKYRSSRTGQYEYWGVDEDGDKFSGMVNYKGNRFSKVKKVIEKKAGISISSCKDFGYTIV